MAYNRIEDYIENNLYGEMKETALNFVEFLRATGLAFFKDNCDCWKNKIYYWVKFNEECVCFIAIKDPDEPDNLWTIWSDDSSAYEDASVSDEIKNVGWQYVDHCGTCGSCSGGKEKVVFGKSFPRVCGCTFRIDNATQEDLPFLKVLVILRVEELIKQETIKHYDLLIDTNNDPVHDSKPLRDYMDKWDGQAFIDSMELDNNKSVLEIGVGTGRLAVRVAPSCSKFCGIDISPKTIDRAKENLAEYRNIDLICADFLSYKFDRKFDVIYSSLTFMHIEDKQNAINKVVTLLKDGGKFVLSIDKNQSEFIDTGTRKIKIYPDKKDRTEEYIKAAGFTILNRHDTEFATIFVVQKG